MVKRGEKYISKLTIKKGKYGKSKVKTFTVLAESPDTWLSSRQLCFYTGIAYHSLARSLPKWFEWGYVDRKPCLTVGMGDYTYRLLPKGQGWLRIAKDNLPNYSLFISELKAWQKDLLPRYGEFMSLGFIPFVEALDLAIRIQEQ